MRNKRFSTLVTLLASMMLFASYTSASATGITLKAAGASSVNTFFDKCKAGYNAATGDTMPYTGAGSGDGKTKIGNGTVDLAFSDSVNTNADKPAGMLHIPFVAWPVTVMVNLNSTKQVNLSVETIAKIFAGKITNWNDPAIAADNNKSYQVPVYKTQNGKTVLDKNGAPVVLRLKTVKSYYTFPDQKIRVIYRSGTSGTTNNFTRVLNTFTSSTVWTKAGNDDFTKANPTDVTLDPLGFQAAAGSQGVAQKAKDTKYSISYNEFGYAAAYGLGVVNVINAAGNSIAPGTDGVLAAFSVAKLAADGVVTFDPMNKLASLYPFAATTYAMVLPKYTNDSIAQSIKDLVTYAAFECPKTTYVDGFAQTTKTSDLGKVILAQVAKINS